MQVHNEDVQNDSGLALIDMCTLNELRINNTFFPHKPQRNVTWSNSRGMKSCIDYIITRNVPRYFVLDVRSLNSGNVGTDHRLVRGILRISLRPQKKPTANWEKYNIESLNTESIRKRYKSRISETITTNPIDENDSANRACQRLKTNIKEAANQAVGRRNTGARKSAYKPWYTPEVKHLASEKRTAYHLYISNPSPQTLVEYKQMRNNVNSRIRTIKSEH